MKLCTPAAVHLNQSHQLLSILVMLAMLAPTLGSIAGFDLWGWRPDHGHASLRVVLGAHAHPGASADSHAGHETPPAGERIVFTAGDLLGSPTLPVSVIALLALPVLLRLSARPAVVVYMRSRRGMPEVPPPR